MMRLLVCLLASQDARAGANFSDLQPIDGVDGVDGLDGSASRPPSESLQPVEPEATQSDQSAIPNRSGLSIPVLTACIAVGCALVAAAAIGAFVIITRRDRRLRRRREAEMSSAGNQVPRSGVPQLALPTGRGSDTPVQAASRAPGSLSTARSHTFDFATGEEDVVVIGDASCLDDCEASHPSSTPAASSAIVVNATGHPISVSGSMVGSSRWCLAQHDFQ